MSCPDVAYLRFHRNLHILQWDLLQVNIEVCPQNDQPPLQASHPVQTPDTNFPVGYTQH